ncbi:MAG: adenylate/guanylate cyclase domain-containing protein, partial [Actinomycetota bacterium]|nr:adenylate/guanylate cyclase domain-containing protein [Actinomycetota bacterium]
MSELDAPAHLAERILRDRAELEGERRTVTVLFVDAVGSTGIGERLDEEEVYALMQGAIALMREAVHRYEGMVTQFLGDGIMSLFGAPIAHEDAVRRAVAAALAIQRSLADYVAAAKRRYGLEVAFRAGLNTGPVVVGRIGNDLHMDYTAIGDTTNLAKRMEENAEPGSVYASERTYQATRDFFEFEDVGAIAVKGKAEPVRAYKALRELPVRTRFEAAAAHALTPLVGRDEELAVLRGHLERAGGGEGQVVLISGEAGIGKSRLLLEFQRALAPDGVRWLTGRCVSFGRNIPYLPITDLLKQAFGIAEGDGQARIIARVD